jgi:endonuclease/exonuclease/phosphatase family metal-dependent hydrolase
MTDLTVATLNLRNLADRWWERAPLVFADFAALQPDVIGLQEVVYPLQQDRLIGAAGDGQYAAFRGFAGRPEYGNAVLVRSPLSTGKVERLDLGANRSALRVPIQPSHGAEPGAELDAAWTFVVTHLHHSVPDEELRARQASDLVDWLSNLPPPQPLVVVGDFNAQPSEPAYRAMTEAGFRSAHVIANGSEPATTWPSGLQAPAIDTDGEPGCMDYIWIRGAIEVDSCRLAFDRPSVDDPTLYPSDHLGLTAQLRIGG